MKRRRFACLLLSILLIASMALPALASSDATAEPKGICQHQRTEQVFLSSYTDYDSNGHWLVSIYKSICRLCGEVVPNSTQRLETNYGRHTNSLISSTHHNNGTHTWTYGCSACPYRSSTTGSCSGPPCPDPV